MATPRPNGCNGAFSHKIDYVTIFKKNLNPEGHPNHITGLKVTAILLKWWKGLLLQPAQQACLIVNGDLAPQVFCRQHGPAN